MEDTTMHLKFAAKLSIYRELHTLTISQLAGKVGVSMDRMEEILSGAHAPNSYTSHLIEEKLGIRFKSEDFVSEDIPGKI